MASVREHMETAALGRPLQLGMLYDCRNDSIVPGITLWDQQHVQHNTNVRSQHNTEFTVTTSDTIEEKSKQLKVDGELKLSLLSGIVNVSGAARYFNDTKKSFIQQRLTLHYKTTNKFEHLTMTHLAQGQIHHHELFDHDIATHVVVAVLYGADAYFVFDKEMNLSDETKDVQGDVKIAADKLKFLCSAGAQVELNMNEHEKAAVKQMKCTFYGDFKLSSNPTTYENAMKVYNDLPKMLGENGEHAVPVKVWLYPLDKLDSRAAKLQRNISTDLIRAVELVIEDLNVTSMRCGDLMEDTVAKTFGTFHNRVQDFQKFCTEYKQDFMIKLQSILPEIRGGKTDIKDLSELLEAHEKSPFRSRDVLQWIIMKEEKSNQIKSLLKQLKELGAEVDADRDKCLLDLNVENLFSYNFTCLQQPEPLLTQQENYLKPSTVTNPSENTLYLDLQEKSWTLEELKCMKNNLKIFKDLINSNKSNKNTRFIVESVPQTPDKPGSCVLIYENGGTEVTRFVPPSKPKPPTVEYVTDNSIKLKISSLCAATLKMQLLHKMTQEKSWKSQSVTDESVTLTNLNAGTDYEIKCAAVGKIDYMVESDVTVTTTTDSVIKHHGAESHQVLDLKFKLILSGKTLNSHKNFITRLKRRVHLKEVNTEDECDFILVFCPIVSRAGTDIEAAMKRLHNISDTKPVVLVVLHHTFYPECVVPDSIKCVNRKNMIAVDCLFHEDTGLLQCLKNNDSLDKTSQYLKELYIKCENMKRQKEGERSRPRNGARCIEKEVTGLEDTNMKPDQTTNVSEESENSQPERNQPLIDRLLIENTQTQQEKDKTLEEKEKQLKQTRAELDKTIKELEDSQRHVEEKNTQIENLNKLLKEKETQLKNTDKELETSTNKLDTLGQELQDKQRQLQDTMIVVEQQKSELAEKKQELQEKERLLTERGTQIMGRDKELQEKDRLLTESHQVLAQDHTTNQTMKYLTVALGCTLRHHVGIEQKFQEIIPALQNVQNPEDCDFIMAFCPVVAIKAAEKMLKTLPGNKPAVLVVLHHPEHIVKDSSRSVNRQNTITVDCLIHEDQRLLQCPENDKALSKVIEFIEDIQGGTPSKSPYHQPFDYQMLKHPRLTYFTLMTGKTLGHHVDIERKLQEQIPGLQKGMKLEESDLVLVFCPVVSRAGTDSEAAVEMLNTQAGDKRAVLVVLHHTFNPELIVPDSSRSVNRQNTITVDCLFYEDQGLLMCHKNNEALSKVVNFLHPKGDEYPEKNTFGNFEV
ncbi:uncharacterized protein LOC113640201 [Tachysurus fulvidraco]|uniref:uncharacterized protein LOC113640201 n=1 Tax=Tachysurus fulvidraco TaxID=1234273 RepID=UPI001FEFE284|nr:uncharacterized protein LOC113640201 [Tachysurus fulvidraco]